MKLRKKAIWRSLFALVFLLLAAGLVAPFLSANRYGPRIRSSLEHALGRKVEIGEVRLNLFKGPGFSVSNVIIYEDPQISLEPFAYLGALEARVSFGSLFSGRLEFSSFRLDEPSINLVKPRSGPWNFEPLLSRTVGATTPQGPAFPLLQVRGGRINFKFGDLKSVFYLIDSDIDVQPPSAPTGEWRIRFSGEPARTDRAAYGLGRFTSRGRWRPDPPSGGRLELFLDLEQSPVADLITLLHGHDIGVHGRVTTHARLAGPVSAIQITGHLEIGDIHRWDLLSPHGQGWPLDYRGQLDLTSQRLELETVPTANTPLPFSVHFRASDYLSLPRWGSLVTLNRFPLAPLPEVARHMGVSLPDGFALAGDLSGVLGYSPEDGIQGKLGCQEVLVKTPHSSLRLQRAEFLLDRARVRLLPTPLLTSGDQQATLEGEYSRETQVLDGALDTDSMRIDELRSASAALLGPVPLLDNCREGIWKGRLRYRRRAATPPDWTGAFQIQQAQVSIPGMAAPFELSSARVALRDGGALMTQIRARLRQLDLEGEYRYRPSAARPHQFRLSIPKLDALELERLLLPTLQRSEGFLARTLGLGRAQVPPWLEERRAEGAVEIGSFSLGDLGLDQLRARLRWDGPDVEITDLEARLAEGALKGRLSVDLGRASPVYRMTANCQSLRWKGGLWDGEGLIQTSGTGADFFRNLRSQGAFAARSVAFDADTECRSLSASYQLTVARGAPRLELSALQAAIGPDFFQGQAATRTDGRLAIELSDGRRQLRATLTLSPFQLLIHPPEPPSP